MSGKPPSRPVGDAPDPATSQDSESGRGLSPEPYPFRCVACDHPKAQHMPPLAGIIDTTCKWRGCGCPWYMEPVREEQS